jgi:outer membrane protein OmpA-like peptidoglycan-associated protein
MPFEVRPSGQAGPDAGARPDSYWEHRQRGIALPIVVGALGLVALGAGQLLPVRDRVESDLTTRSEGALQHAGLPGLQVSFSGRDGAVRGPGASLADLSRAAEIVRGIEGVRVVEIQGSPVNPGGPVAAPGGQTPVGGQPPATEIPHSSSVVTVSPSSAVSPSGSAGAPSTAGPAATVTPVPITPAPAPAPAPSSPLAVRSRLAALPPITFASGSVGLTPQGRASVSAAARILSAAPRVRVVVRGYTDDIGDWHVNLGLSRARAAGVRQALIARGVSAGQLTAAGYSEDFPRVANNSSDHRAQNRRVELAVR